MLPPLSPALAVPLEPRNATVAEVKEFVAAGRALYAPCLALAGGAPKEFLRPVPVAWARLEQAGLEEYPVQWLFYRGYLEHCAGPEQRPAGPRLRDDSTLILTLRGLRFVEGFLNAVDDGNRPEAGCELLQVGRLAPQYDLDERRFRWGVHVVKLFRQPAGTQEWVLRAAQELAWPRWLDDPLPRPRGARPKTRRRNTLQDLNRFQRRDCVRFDGDRTGLRIGWVCC